MDKALKQRLVGAAVLVSLAVIFLPMVLEVPARHVPHRTTAIPARPEGGLSAPTVSVEEPEVVITRARREMAEAARERKLPLVGIGNGAAARSQDAAAAPDDGTPDASESASLDAPPEQSTTGAPPRDGPVAWVVQVGSFKARTNAEKLSTQLRGQGFKAFVEESRGKETSYRVRVGPEVTRTNALALKEQLEKDANIKGLVLRYP
jgi:DedD protein